MQPPLLLTLTRSKHPEVVYHLESIENASIQKEAFGLIA